MRAQRWEMACLPEPSRYYATDDAYTTGVPARWHRRMTSGQRVRFPIT
jgi:hypothetical protein